MNIKKILTKTIASALLITSFAGTLPTFAVLPSTDLPICRKDFDGCVSEFKALAPDVFDVDPELGSNPEISTEILSAMISILRKYPNITRKIANMAKDHTENRKLIIRASKEIDILARMASSYSPQSGAFNALDKSEFTTFIKLDDGFLNENKCPPILHEEFSSTRASYRQIVAASLVSELFYAALRYERDRVKFNTSLRCMSRMTKISKEFYAIAQESYGSEIPDFLTVLQIPDVRERMLASDLACSHNVYKNLICSILSPAPDIAGQLLEHSKKHGYTGNISSLDSETESTLTGEAKETLRQAYSLSFIMSAFIKYFCNTESSCADTESRSLWLGTEDFLKQFEDSQFEDSIY